MNQNIFIMLVMLTSSMLNHAGNKHSTPEKASLLFKEAITIACENTSPYEYDISYEDEANICGSVSNTSNDHQAISLTPNKWVNIQAYAVRNHQRERVANARRIFIREFIRKIRFSSPPHHFYPWQIEVERSS